MRARALALMKETKGTTRGRETTHLRANTRESISKKSKSHQPLSTDEAKASTFLSAREISRLAKGGLPPEDQRLLHHIKDIKKGGRGTRATGGGGGRVKPTAPTPPAATPSPSHGISHTRAKELTEWAGAMSASSIMKSMRFITFTEDEKSFLSILAEQKEASEVTVAKQDFVAKHEHLNLKGLERQLSRYRYTTTRTTIIGYIYPYLYIL